MRLIRPGDTEVPQPEGPTSGRAPELEFRFKGERVPVEAIPWPMWQTMRREFGDAPGWCFGRFGIRGDRPDGSEVTVQMFGLAKGAFAVYGDQFIMCGVGPAGEPMMGNLSVVLHLTSGTGMWLCINDQDAIKMAEIAARCDDGPWDNEAGSGEGWSEAIDKVEATFKMLGLDVCPWHAHDTTSGLDGPPMRVWGTPRPGATERPVLS